MDERQKDHLRHGYRHRRKRNVRHAVQLSSDERRRIHRVLYRDHFGPRRQYHGMLRGPAFSPSTPRRHSSAETVRKLRSGRRVTTGKIQLPRSPDSFRPFAYDDLLSSGYDVQLEFQRPLLVLEPKRKFRSAGYPYLGIPPQRHARNERHGLRKIRRNGRRFLFRRLRSERRIGDSHRSSGFYEPQSRYDRLPDVLLRRRYRRLVHLLSRHFLAEPSLWKLNRK